MPGYKRRRVRTKKERHACPTGKIRYKDKMSADRVLRSAAKDATRDKLPIRAYPCDRCKGFHLTSLER